MSSTSELESLRLRRRGAKLVAQSKDFLFEFVRTYLDAEEFENNKENEDREDKKLEYKDWKEDYIRLHRISHLAFEKGVDFWDRANGLVVDRIEHRKRLVLDDSPFYELRQLYALNKRFR